MSSAANLYPAPGTIPAQSAQQAMTAMGPAGMQQPVGTAATGKTGKLAAFEGFLKKAGHIAGVVLADIVKYAIPVASVVAVADPQVEPAVAAFTASVKLVQGAVVAVQQRWAAQGPAANAQKLADVLEIVEQPVVTMFAQAGLQVDAAYVTNLVNGVVAILNAQPAVVLPAQAA